MRSWKITKYLTKNIFLSDARNGPVHTSECCGDQCSKYGQTHDEDPGNILHLVSLHRLPTPLKAFKYRHKSLKYRHLCSITVVHSIYTSSKRIFQILWPFFKAFMFSGKKMTRLITEFGVYWLSLVLEQACVLHTYLNTHPGGSWQGTYSNTFPI